MPEMTALSTAARRTVFRKLKQLPYRTSYSHCGRYYTLAGPLPQADLSWSGTSAQ